MMLSTDTGKLNRRITIQYKTVTTDSIGNQSSAWADYYSCWANVTGVSGREYWSAREQHEENTVSFKIRYCNTLAQLGTVDYRINYNNRLYDITSIDNLQAADSIMIIKAIERT